MRLLVYTDYAYHREGSRVYAERAFALFLGGLAEHLQRMVICGRLDPGSSRARYPLGRRVEFVGLPYYRSLVSGAAVAATVGSARRFWSALGGVDAVWLLGPHPFALVFAALSLLRGKRLLLGVRQDTPRYVRSRHPGRPLLALGGSLLDRAYRALARRCATVVVGPALARRYRHARRLLEITVSLVDEPAPDTGELARGRSYDGELTLLWVGRLETEKNPLLAVEVLAELERAVPGRWRLLLCGEGPLAEPAAGRARELGIAELLELRGYLDHELLRELYREAHLLLITSWTEGFPQIVVEAFAAGLPVVATDVGGIREAAGDAVCLVAPGDRGAAVAALQRLAADSGARQRLVDAGLAYASEHTLTREVERLAAFVS